MIFKIDPTKSVVCFVDASFAGDWNQSWSEEPSLVFSRTGYIIYFGGCPIIWHSKLQSEISLSTTEAEYIALSQSMRDNIPLMALIGELAKVLPIITEKAKVHYTVFEDNNSCIELVKCPRMRSRTKHIGLKYHHFRSKVKEKMISVHRVDTKMQHRDLLTKALAEPQFVHLRKLITGR